MLLNKIKEIVTLEKIQLILYVILIYIMGNRRDFKYDEYFIILLGVLTILKDKISLEDIKIKILDIFILINILLYSFSYYKTLSLNSFILDVRINTIISIVLKCFFFFLIVQQMRLKEIKYTMPLIVIGSIYPIYKIFNYGLKYNFKNRIVGFWGNSNYVGFFLGLIFLLGVILSFNYKKLYLKIFYFSISAISFFELLLISRSRNALLGVVICTILTVVLTFGINKKCIYWILGIIAILMGIFVKFNSRFLQLFNINILKNDGRIAVYKNSLDILKTTPTPLLGKGFNSFFGGKLVGGLEGTHNDILELLLNHGIIGFLFYTIMFGFILYLLIGSYRLNKNIYSIAGIVLWLYILILGLFDNAIGASRVYEITFLIFAVALNTKNKNYKL